MKQALSNLLAIFRRDAKTEREKGTYFEELISTYLRYEATIKNIPVEVYECVVNGKPVLEWVMERQHVKTDEDSGIVNDANLYATETVGDPSYPLKLFQRVGMRVGMAFWALFGIVCLLSFPTIADDCGGISCTCVGCGVSSSPPPSYSDDSKATHERDNSAEREAHNARVHAVNAAAEAAYARADYKEALRLYLEQQKLRDGPKVRHNIAVAQDAIAKTEARVQAERQRDREKEEARVIAEQNLLAREAAAIRTATKMREKIDAFAASLDTTPPQAGRVVTQGGTVVVEHAEAPLKFGSSDDLEAMSEQGRQGLDKEGFLKGAKPVPAVGDPASSDPEVIAAEEELAALVVERAKVDAEIEALTLKRNVEKDPATMQQLTLELSKQQNIKGQKLVDIYQKEQKNKRLRRTINTRVAGEGEKSE